MEITQCNRDMTPDREIGLEISDEAPTLIGRQYRYNRFTTGLLLRDLRFRKGTLGPGDALPAVDLVTTAGDELGSEDLLHDRPLLLVFGSISCPMTASAVPFLKQLHAELGDEIDFVMINTREAHPGENFTQPATPDEKLDHARALKQLYDLPWSVVTDDIEGSLHRALDPKPNSAFIVDSSGIIVFRSLWASDQSAIRSAVVSVIAGRRPKKAQSQRLIGPVARAMGRVQEVMDRAGPQAVKDLWLGGPPMALAGRVATFFTPLSADHRGLAAVFTLAIGMLLVLGSIAAWFLG